MRHFVAGFLVGLAILSSTCDARRGGALGQGRGKNSYRDLKKTFAEIDNGKFFPGDDKIESDDFDLPVFDDDTEALAETLDLFDDIIDEDTDADPVMEDADRENMRMRWRERKAQKGRHGFKGNRQGGRQHRRCITLEEKAEIICTKIDAAIENNMLGDLLFNGRDSDKKKAAWIDCCSVDGEDRFECFRESQTRKINSMCESSQRKRTSRCCEVKDEDRVDCFERIKEKMCSKTAERPQPTCNYIPANLTASDNSMRGFPRRGDRDMEDDREHRDGERRKGSWRQFRGKAPRDGEMEDRKSKRISLRQNKRMETRRNTRMCCRAGKLSRANETEASCDMCINNFESWAENDMTMSHMCSEKFIWCCMHLEAAMSSEEEDADSMDEESVDGSMDDDSDEKSSRRFNCCAAGRRRSNGAGGLGSKLECYRGQQELQRTRPELGTQCIDTYYACCIQPKRRPSKEDRPSTGPRGRNSEDIPEGFRRDYSNGRQYFVDSPDLMN